PEREGLGEPQPAEEHVRPDQPVVAQLVGLADRLRAQPELVGVCRRRGGADARDHHRGDARAEHPGAPYHVAGCPRATVTRSTVSWAPPPRDAMPHAPRSVAATAQAR